MNIAHVITRLIIGGAQENTVLTCRGLVERGHGVTLLAGPETGPEGSLWSMAEASGARLIRIPHMRRAVQPLNELRGRGELVRVFRKIKPDIVHTHSSKAGIIGRSAARATNVPLIVHTIHGMSFNRTQSARTQMLYRWLERRQARHTHAFITVADAMIEQAVAAGIAPRQRFTTIRSGMETDRFAPDAEQRATVRGEWHMSDDDIIVGTVARLFENKGYEELLSAMPSAVKKQPRLKFVWIGDGPHHERYESRLRELGLRDRVHFTGLISPQQVARQLTGLDMLVHASRWEGLPRAVVQALLTGVPAIGFDNDGTPEVVMNDVTGKLLAYGDTAGLSRAMVELAADASLRQRLGSEGRRRTLIAFDWRRMVAEIEQLYERSRRD